MVIAAYLLGHIDNSATGSFSERAHVSSLLRHQPPFVYGHAFHSPLIVLVTVKNNKRSLGRRRRMSVQNLNISGLRVSHCTLCCRLHLQLSFRQAESEHRRGSVYGVRRSEKKNTRVLQSLFRSCFTHMVDP